MDLKAGSCGYCVSTDNKLELQDVSSEAIVLATTSAVFALIVDIKALWKLRVMHS